MILVEPDLVNVDKKAQKRKQSSAPRHFVDCSDDWIFEKISQKIEEEEYNNRATAVPRCWNHNEDAQTACIQAITSAACRTGGIRRANIAIARTWNTQKSARIYHEADYA